MFEADVADDMKGHNVGLDNLVQMSLRRVEHKGGEDGGEK